MLVIPTDYAWNTWSMSNITNNTTYITQTTTDSSGVATSANAGYDAGSGYVWDKLDWVGVREYGIFFEARTANSSAGLSSATYFDISKDCVFPIAQRKRYLQARATLLTPEGNQPDLYYMYLYSNLSSTADLTDTKGLDYGADGSRPTWDGAFGGRYYQCAVCGAKKRRQDMIVQRGGLVCRDTCKDVEKSRPSSIQIRSR